MRLALMDDDGHGELLRQRHLQAEGPLLHIPRGILIVIVQADLADGLHARVFAQLAVDGDPRLVHLRGVVRVAADGGVDPAKSLGQLHRLFRRRQIEANLHHAGDGRSLHVFHNAVKVLCKTVLGQMRV